MLTLSIRQPWAWLILHAGKDIENRAWPTKVRSRILIHAARTMIKKDYDAAVFFAVRRCGVSPAIIPDYLDLPRGGIVGSVEITGCVKSSTSPWFEGEYGFLLRNPEILPFKPTKGQLGFFDIPWRK